MKMILEVLGRRSLQGLAHNKIKRKIEKKTSYELRKATRDSVICLPKFGPPTKEFLRLR